MLSCSHKAEVFLISFQKTARALKEPVKALQPNVCLVAHPVGASRTRQRAPAALVAASPAGEGRAPVSRSEPFWPAAPGEAGPSFCTQVV